MGENSATLSELARLSELVDGIYQCATDPIHWPRVMFRIADYIDAPKGQILTPRAAPDEGGYHFSYNVPEAMTQQLWAPGNRKKDVWAQRSLEKGMIVEGTVLLGEELIPIEEFVNTEIYRDLFSKHDVAHLLGSIVFGSGSAGDLPWAVCAWYQGLDDGPFSEQQRDRLRLLVPHLSRALGTMIRLRDTELRVAASFAALDNLVSGVLLLDARGRVAFANRAALGIFGDGDGLGVRHCASDSSLGELAAEDTKARRELAAAIAGAVSPDILDTTHFSRAVMIPRLSGRAPYVLNFSSLAARNEFGRGSDVPRAIVFISDNACPVRLDPELLRQSYGLTVAEIRLMELMGESLTLDEAASRLGISRNTVKVQLQSIYDKTGTNSRAKLMRLISSLSRRAD